ncbi:MAG: MBL fold metallo-hydrolase [Acidobacteria bacterium]|nr:MBL fold metallo-hydrolase [Acidobacteriota bacterium]MBU4306530.1 MBL fold metallo-hydrolase [Acidobacteriota bacterium]MBU4404944.1 MBL fold metallo-hydrolase [Acidobacteriota bacterium]MCG2810979.1 MBL fold metallo-hydrolase [Candidatus Aminicenantes bacterium]
MRKNFFFIFFIAVGIALTGQAGFESDVFKTTAADLRVTFIGHGSLLFNFGNLHIYIDPDGRLADFSLFPKADLILITHQHGDHFDPAAIKTLSQDSTQLFLSPACQPLPAAAHILKNGDSIQAKGVAIAAVPAYNILHQRANGLPFHPRGEGNGYVLTFAGLRVYVAGDTENIPEMNDLRDITVAFLPMNLPYTMTPEMTAKAAQAIKPRLLYPYHFSDTDPQKLVSLLKDDPAIEVRIRKLN